MENLTYDNIIELFFYLWDQASDTILGKPVVICNDMPDAKLIRPEAVKTIAIR